MTPHPSLPSPQALKSLRARAVLLITLAMVIIVVVTVVMTDYMRGADRPDGGAAARRKPPRLVVQGVAKIPATPGHRAGRR